MMVWPVKSSGSLAKENAELRRQLESAKERIRVLLLEQFQQKAEITRLREYLPAETRHEALPDRPESGPAEDGAEPDGATKQFINDFYRAA
jgi:hypothetical protein